MTERSDRITLAHGGGGRLSRELIEHEILPRFACGPLAGLPDAAALGLASSDILFTTDGFVVKPLEFPGGNIGELAVYGTVNDIAVAGGLPKWISVALVVEEGLPLSVLRMALDGVREAAVRCDVTVAAGDTKVVNRGQCDGLYVTTSGIGTRIPEFSLAESTIRDGDAVLVSGTLGDHGMAVMSVREGIDLGGSVLSDSGPVHRLVLAARSRAADVRFMRDPTRGGLAAVLNEIVVGRQFGVVLRESALPFSDGTRAVAELLGFDLLNSACEGRVVCVCDASAAAEILGIWRSLSEGRGAAEIGSIVADAGRVALETVAGGRRLVDVPYGELLPRIC